MSPRPAVYFDPTDLFAIELQKRFDSDYNADGNGWYVDTPEWEREWQAPARDLLTEVGKLARDELMTSRVIDLLPSGFLPAPWSTLAREDRDRVLETVEAVLRAFSEAVVK